MNKFIHPILKQHSTPKGLKINSLRLLPKAINLKFHNPEGVEYLYNQIYLK